MKPRVAIPLAVAGMLFGLGTTVANANGWFAGHPSLVYWCWAGSVILVAIAIVGAILNARSDKRAPVQENKQTDEVNPDDPQVIIKVSGERLPWRAKDEFPKERPIYLENLGRSPAYKVQVQPVILPQTKTIAIFPEITPLVPQMPVPIRPKLEFEPREELLGVSEFEVLMQVEWPCGAGFDKELIVPIQITYEDHRNRKFRTDLKFGYCFRTGSRTFDFQFTRLS